MRSNITWALHQPDCVDIEFRISKGLTLDMSGGRPFPLMDLMVSTYKLLLSRTSTTCQSSRVCNSVMSSLSTLIFRFSVLVTLCVVYAAHLRWRGRMRVARDMYASVCMQEVVDSHIYLSRYLAEFIQGLKANSKSTPIRTRIIRWQDKTPDMHQHHQAQ
jgi:hypothetical protein